MLSHVNLNTHSFIFIITQDIAYAAGGKYYQVDLEGKQAVQSVTKITKENIMP
jgi:Mg-chelatase subunit ChlD